MEYLFSVFIPKVFASSASGPGSGTPIPSFFSICGTATEGPFLCILNKVLGVLLDISTPIVAIMVVIGAIQIMLANGNSEKIIKGRKTILYAVVGFTIILLATSVVPVLTSLLS